MERPGLIPAGAKQIPATWFVKLDNYLKAITGRSSAGVRVNVAPGGTTYDVLKNVGLASVVVPRAFQVIAGPKTSGSTGNPQIGVIADSHVINSADKDTNEEDNSDWGLLTDDAPDDDPGWFVVPEIGSKIWLQFTFDADGNLTDISLEYGVVGTDQWDEYPDPISINTDDESNPYQEFYHLLIAEVTDPEQDPRPGFQVTFSDGTAAQVTQILNTNVELVPAATTSDADTPNLPIMVAIPWTAPGTAIDGSADEINYSEGSDIKTPWSFSVPADDPWHPFQIHAEDADSEGKPQVSVDGNSDFWKDFSTKQAVTGLDEPFSVAEGNLIYMVIQMNSKDDPSPKSATITCDDGWEEHPNPNGINTDDDSGPWQQYYNQIIAEVVATDDPREGLTVGSGDNAVKIIQKLDQSLRCTLRAPNGIVLCVPETCSA